MSITDDDLVELFNEGWDAAVQGVPAESCPYDGTDTDDVVLDGAKRRLWMDGWKAAADNPARE